MVSPAALSVGVIGGSNSWIVILITIGAFVGAAVAAARPKSAPAFRRTPPLATIEPDPVGRVEAPQTRWLERGLLAILTGYILFDRPFAWIHVPGTPLFVGEMVIALGVTVMLTTKTLISRLIRSSSALKMLRTYMLWGAALLAFNILPYGLDAVRDSALWYYGIVALFVVILFISRPQRVIEWTHRFARLIPIYLLWFPFALVLAQSGPRSIRVPDSNVFIFTHKSGDMAVLAALAIAFLWMVDSDSTIFTRRGRIWLTTLATLVVVITGLQNRGGMVASALVIAALLVLLSRRRSELLVLMTTALVLTASAALVLDIRIELFGDREISVEQFTNNISSILDPEAGGSRQSSTTAWRLNIWEQVLNDVTNETPIMGFGPGPDLGRRYEISGDPNQPLRNPHNSHVGILARLGWTGIVLWVMLWITWAAEIQTMRRRLRRRGRYREAALAGWLLLTPLPILVNAIFDPTLEGAQVAVILWTFFGAGTAMVILARQNRLPDMGSTSATRTQVDPEMFAPAR
jgi:hypothetical protein